MLVTVALAQHLQVSLAIPNHEQNKSPVVLSTAVQTTRTSIAWASILCTVARNVRGSSAWNLLHVTLLAPRIFRWLLDFKWPTRLTEVKKNGRAIPLKAWRCPQGSRRSRHAEFVDNRHMWVASLSAMKAQMERRCRDLLFL